ncbi:hypothetical protein [Bacillus sp. AFS017274]|uniref:hypothetical protein n=1 Tax=Bacillaceae TaxID=186817 RepID=UPI0015CEFF78|nr:hypothetical protein [Bacillus sp. AFS017274]
MALDYLEKRRGNGGKKIFVIVDENDRIIGTEPMGGDFIDPKKSEMSKKNNRN